MKLPLLPKKSHAIVFAWLLASVLCGLLFYLIVITGGTYFFVNTTLPSAIFGWQWILLLFGTLGLFIYGAVKHRKKYLLAAGILAAALLITWVPSRIIFETQYYLVGEGGPAGPTMTCLGWHSTGLTDIYDTSWDIGCSLMSIPGYNKALFDQSYGSDSTDLSAPYLAMFALNEAILIGATVFALRFAYKPTKA